MKLMVFSIVFFSLLLLIPQNMFAEGAEMQGILVPVTESCNCKLFAQMEVRNSSDEITAVIIPRSYSYLEHSLTQDLLYQTSITEQIFLNEKKFDVREFTTEIMLEENNHFLDRISLTKTTDQGKITIFYATDLGYPVIKGDKLTTIWKIMTLSS